MSSDRNRYRFSLSPNLNKLLTDRRASVQPKAIGERIREAVELVFRAGPAGVDRVYFPERSGQVSDRAALTVVVVAPEQSLTESATRKLIEQIVREHGTSARTFKSALLFAVGDGSSELTEEARSVLAWEDIRDDDETVKRLDEGQKRQLKTASETSARDLRESVWRTYKNVLLLGKDNQLKEVDLGLVHSSAAGSLVELIVNRLRAYDEITDGVGPTKLVKYWPPALEAWSTKAMRDAFYSSPALPRLMDPNTLKRTIVDGVAQGLFAYTAKDASGRYHPFHFQESLAETNVEIADDMFLLRAEDAKKHIEPPRLARVEVKPARVLLKPGEQAAFTVSSFDQHDLSYPSGSVSWGASGGKIDEQGFFVAEALGSYVSRAKVGAFEATAEADVTKEPPPPPPGRGIAWRGKVPAQKWMNFYTKVVARFVSAPGIELEVQPVVPPSDGVTEAKAQEARSALRELGLSEDLKFK